MVGGESKWRDSVCVWVWSFRWSRDDNSNSCNPSLPAASQSSKHFHEWNSHSPSLVHVCDVSPPPRRNISQRFPLTLISCYRSYRIVPLHLLVSFDGLPRRRLTSCDPLTLTRTTPEKISLSLDGYLCWETLLLLRFRLIKMRKERDEEERKLWEKENRFCWMLLM